MWIGANIAIPIHGICFQWRLYQGVLLAQGSSEKSDVYAKQFAEYKNLKGLGRWFAAVGAKPGDWVRAAFTLPASLTIELL